MRRLDEAILAAVAGEMTDIDATCPACCCLIFACEWTRDYERAGQWIERLRELAARWPHPVSFAFCRIHYAGLLILQGAWPEAEADLMVATTELAETQPALAAKGLVRLAELHCRQGRFDKASALFERVELPPFRNLAGDFCLSGRAAWRWRRPTLTRPLIWRNVSCALSPRRLEWSAWRYGVAEDTQHVVQHIDAGQG